MIFVDTNVLLYSHDRRNVEKAGQAQSWLRALAKHRQATINLQVLNELTDVLLRRKWFETPEQVFAISAGFAELGDKPLTEGETEEARRLHLRYRYSWWDCLLLAPPLNWAARTSSPRICRTDSVSTP